MYCKCDTGLENRISNELEGKDHLRSNLTSWFRTWRGRITSDQLGFLFLWMCGEGSPQINLPKKDHLRSTSSDNARPVGITSDRPTSTNALTTLWGSPQIDPLGRTWRTNATISWQSRFDENEKRRWTKNSKSDGVDEGCQPADYNDGTWRDSKPVEMVRTLVCCR